MTSSLIRIVIVDDHEMVRRGLATFLRTSPDFVLVGEAADGREALEKCGELLPDVVLMDVMMPGMDGFGAITALRERFPQIAILALSSSGEPATVAATVRAGAVGYLLKSVSIDELATAIYAAREGKPSFSPKALQALIEGVNAPYLPNYHLSERELSVLRLLVEGKNNPEIAQALSISRSTVKYHMSAIIAKLGVSNRAEAVAVAVKQRLVP